MAHDVSFLDMLKPVEDDTEKKFTNRIEKVEGMIDIQQKYNNYGGNGTKSFGWK